MTESLRDKIVAYILNDSIPADAVKGVWSGFTYPGDVLAGHARPDDMGRVVDTAGLMLGGVASGGSLAKSTENVASRNPRLYDPPVKSPRPFEADYPAGALSDDAGKLVSDIDGRQLSARYVVGRGEVSGPDVGLPREALDEIAKARTGEAIRYVAPGSPELGRDVGRAKFGSSGEPDHVALSRSLEEPQRSRVAQHEIGHVIDQTAGEIPHGGLNAQLRSVYNDINNPQSFGKPFGPEQNGYRGAEVPRELMTEAIRAYMADPNYIKTVAPETAARIRQYVNDNPKLRDIIQFNSVGPAAAGAGVAAGLYDWSPPATEDDRFGALYRAGRAT